jgi:hypothetical protein
MPLDQLLKDEEFPETERLLRSTGLKHLNQVADRKGMELCLHLEELKPVIVFMDVTVNVNNCLCRSTAIYGFIHRLFMFNKCWC